MEPITAFLERIKTVVPVEWDRFTYSSMSERQGVYNIYGWIHRTDGQRDFLLLLLTQIDGYMYPNFVTSSAKYSKLINAFLFGENAPHSDCIKISELYDTGK